MRLTRLDDVSSVLSSDIFIRLILELVSSSSQAAQRLFPRPFISNTHILNASSPPWHLVRFIYSFLPAFSSLVTVLTDTMTPLHCFLSTSSHVRLFYAPVGNPPDLVITLGGDGTILHVSSLFNGPLAACPPILSFSMGSLGFLLPFRQLIFVHRINTFHSRSIVALTVACGLSDVADINSFKEALADVYEGRSTLLDRMRLAVDVFDENGKLSDRCGDQGMK